MDERIPIAAAALLEERKREQRVGRERVVAVGTFGGGRGGRDAVGRRQGDRLVQRPVGQVRRQPAQRDHDEQAAGKRTDRPGLGAPGGPQTLVPALV